MKLIIDISNKNIARLRSYYGHGYRVFNDKEDEVEVVEAIYNAKPLQTEFEEIKAEIHDMLKSDEVKNDYWGNLINNKAHLFLSIIDNHISELKGESNE